MDKRYKLYLASGIRLWNLYFKDQYSESFNKKLDLFQPALIDNQYARDHRLIPIKIATKDLGEINKCDAVLAYMKNYDTQNNGPAGTDSSWECGYAIGLEKPTIMLVEDLQHLDYYAAQWMITFSIGAILTTNKAVAEAAKNSDKFTHTRILYSENKEQFENKVIEYLDTYHKSIYAREGIINFFVDAELRNYAERKKLLPLLETRQLQAGIYKNLDVYFNQAFKRTRRFLTSEDYRSVCDYEIQRAKTVANIIADNYDLLPGFLDACIQKHIENFESKAGPSQIAEMIEYWLNVPAKKLKGRRQGNKKTRPTIFYELYDLVSHHIVQSQKYFPQDFAYKMGAIIEMYNWLNTYAIDDVFDNSVTRQGNKSLHVKYQSRKNALLLGGIGHCLALKLLFLETRQNMEIGKELIKSLNQVQLVMYQGQLLDLDLSFNNPKRLKNFLDNNTLTSAQKLYFKRTYLICGAFYEQIGRMAMQSTNVGAQFYHKEEIEEACVYIAKLFGLTQMIRNDLGDYIFPEMHSKMGKGMKLTSHNDIGEGKLTLPLIYSLLCPNVSAAEKKQLSTYIGKKNLSRQDKMAISKLIWESGAIEFCMQFVEYFSTLVTDQYIKHIHETPTRLKWIVGLMDITSLINKTFRQLADKNKWKKLEPMRLENKKIEELLRIQ